jgi:hypothetical protein
MQFFKRVGSLIAIFGAAALLVRQFPSVQAFSVDFTAAGWAVLIAGIVAWAAVQVLVKRAVAARFGIDPDKYALYQAVDEATGWWLIVPVIVAVGRLVVPAWFVLSSPLGGVLVFIVFGVAAGIAKYVGHRLDANPR